MENNFTDKLIEEFENDYNSVSFTEFSKKKLSQLTDLKTYHNSYADYMNFVNGLTPNKPKYTAEEIAAALESEKQFTTLPNKEISDTATIIRATGSGYIVKIIYNKIKSVILVLLDFYFIEKYKPVPYINKADFNYSVEHFINDFSALNVTDLLYRAVRFHESNIPTRYAGQVHGPKRVGTFYKTYLYENKLQAKYSNISLKKLTDQSYLKKGPGDNKPDFSYIEDGKIKYAEAKMDITINEAIEACKAVNMTPFPNRLYILVGKVLTMYNLDKSELTAEILGELDLPEIPDLPETW